MPNDLQTGKGSIAFPKRQGPPRKSTLGANVTASEKLEVDDALAQAGFRNEAEGVRVVLFAFRDEAAVRDAVAKYRRRMAA